MKDKIKTYLSHILEDIDDKVPNLVFDFWVNNYGAQIEKLIVDNNGEKWKIDRILTLDNKNEVNTKSISWRNNLNPEALDYSVPYLESVLSNWEEHDKLIPIAGINSNDMVNYDLLVINFLDSHDPKVSIWVHEESFGYEEPYLVDVSDNFKDFLAKWNLLD